MKALPYYLLVSFSLCLVMCTSTNDSLLYDQLGLDPLVNPITTNLTTGDKIYAWMAGDSAIVGFGGGFAFYTPNLFDSIYGIEGTVVEEIIYNDFENIIVRPANVVTDDLFLQESTNFGETYLTKLNKSANESYVSGGVAVEGTHDFQAISFLNKEVGWFFSNYTATSGSEVFDSGLKVYTIVVNGYTGNTEVNNIADLGTPYVAQAAHFFSTYIGYLLAQDYAGYTWLLRTEDGGYTWQTPTLVSDDNTKPATDFHFVSFERLVAYNPAHKVVYTSGDDGDTWQSGTLANANLGITDLYFPNETVGYACSPVFVDEIGQVSDIYKTTDGGLNWNKVNANYLYADHLDFMTDDIGLAVSGNAVQYTNDGGTSWKVLVYPLE
jgi:hypothetical protein